MGCSTWWGVVGWGMLWCGVVGVCVCVWGGVVGCSGT